MDSKRRGNHAHRPGLPVSAWTAVTGFLLANAAFSKRRTEQRSLRRLFVTLAVATYGQDVISEVLIGDVDLVGRI